MSNQPGTSRDLPSTSRTTRITRSSTAKKNGQQGAVKCDLNGHSSEEVNREQATDEYIRICVVTADKTHRIVFRMKRHKTLKRLKYLSCDKLEYEVSEHFFFFGDHLVTDEDTPLKLRMMNDDVLELN